MPPVRSSRENFAIRSFKRRRQIPRTDAGYPLADVCGEIAAAIGFFGALGDAPKPAQFLQRVALIETADAVNVLRKITGENQPVAQWQIADDALHHLVDQRGAIDRNGVVE